MKGKRFISAVTAIIVMFSGMAFSEYIPFSNSYNEITAVAFSVEESYQSSATYTSSCIIGGLVDLETGSHSESVTKYSDVITRNYAYEQLANNVMEDKGLVITSAMWDTFSKALDGKASAVDSELRQEQVYEAFLMDYLTFSEGSTENSTLLDKAGDFADKTMKYENKIFKKLLDKGIADDEKSLIDLIEKSDSLNDPKVVEAMKELNWEKDLVGYTEVLDDITEVATNAKDYFEVLTKAMALKEVNDERIEFLKSMSEKASDNSAFQTAVDNIIETIESSYGEITLKEGVKTMGAFAWDKCWDSISKNIPYFSTFKTAHEVMNDLFNTDSMAENNIRIIMQYTAGQYAKQVLMSAYIMHSTSGTEEADAAFVEAYKNYLAYQDYSSEWAKDFVEAVPFASSTTVDEWLSDLNSDINYCNKGIEFADKYTEIYNKAVYPSYEWSDGFDANINEYVWYLEPTVEADDINVVTEFGFQENYGHFIESEYHIIEQNNKYGVIDMKGNIIVEPQYSMFSNETNNHFVFSNSDDWYSHDIFCTKSGNINRRNGSECKDCNGWFATTAYEYYGCYDKEQKLFSRMSYAIPSYGNITTGYLQGQNSFGIITDNYFETAQLAKFSDDNETVELYNKFGIVKNGKIVVDFDYDNALTYKYGITAMKKDNIWEYFNENGDVLICTECAEGVTEYYWDNKYSSLNPVILPYLPSYGYIAVNNSQGGGYYDINGNSVISVGNFESVRPVYENMAWVKDKETGLWGVLNIEKTVENSMKDTGDMNQDGKITIADAVLMQKYLLGSCSFSKTQWTLADMNQDGCVDVFDMVVMRKLLIENK